jgi:hypothetical protein
MAGYSTREREAEEAWDELRRELDAWTAAGRDATLWWRDDDAVAMSPALARLLALADGVPLALAVIPAGAEGFEGEATVLQHGWSHANNAPAASRKCELVDLAVVDRLVAGKERLERLFGARFLAVIAPPWNRIAAAVAARLPALGYRGLSVLGPRRSRFETNVHVDVMDWRARRFAGDEAVLRRLAAHLSARRAGAVDADEPTGVMTHHLVHGGEAERFLARLFATTRAHPAARWLEPRAVFGAA